MAVRTRYDIAKGWGGGFIWLAQKGSLSGASGFPDWARGLNLKLVILHELGHVLGVPHVRGTVMDEDLSQQLQRGDAVLGQIDQRQQLVECWRCVPFRYDGKLGYDDAASPDAAAKVFRRFAGRPPRGEVRASLDGSQTAMTLILQDTKGAKSLPLDLDFGLPGTAIHSAFDRGARIFKAVWAPHGVLLNVDLFNGGSVLYGAIRDASGSKLNLAVEVNSHSLGSPGPFTLRWLEDGRAHALFFSGRRDERASTL